MPTTRETPARQFRLEADVLADIDYIASELSVERGGKASRADAIRQAVRRDADRRRKKISKKS
jgi:Arc/MetJ-type ribon-helix-helix transcriptional regulator